MAPKNPENNESKNNQAPENNSPQFEIDKKSQEADKKRFYKRVGAIACAFAVFVGIVGFVVKNNSNKNNVEQYPQETTMDTPTVETTQSQEQTDNIPEEAKYFMENFGDNFSDPLSTYYAEKAYEDAHNGGGLLLDNDYIEGYGVTYDTIGDTSELGFKKINIKFDKEMDQAGSIDIFNNYIAVNLDRYMNMIAKNPVADAKSVIDCQFLAYCENMDGPDAVNVSQNAKRVDMESDKLLGTLNNVVSKYGSTANYSIALATNDDTVEGATLFSTPTHALVNIDNVVSGYQENSVRLVIDVDVYTGKEVSHIQEVIEGVQLNVMQRCLGDTQVSFGQN